MRKRFEPQLQIGQVDIADLQFDLRSRDEIPKILIGLQHVFTTPELREKAFEILETVIPDNTFLFSESVASTLYDVHDGSFSCCRTGI